MNTITLVFKIVCISAVFIFTIMWIQRYQLDKDTTVVENRSFGTTEDDILPVMSMCFEQTFDDHVFSKYGGEKINAF